MIQLIICHGTGDFITHGAHCHIQSFKLVIACPVSALANQLNASHPRILSGIFRKALCLAKVICSCMIVGFQNVKDVSLVIILADNDKIRICRLLLSACLIGNTESTTPLSLTAI